MLPYPDTANPDLLEKIPLDARVVLDVGCGSGALGAEYRRRNPSARLLGIEANPDAARVAAARFDQVANVDVDDKPLPFGDVAIDCIIYGDVLEHLRDPWKVLAAQATLLSPTGTVLICMPNVEHWSFVERLLRGTWSYEKQGLLDRTHLRWFNFETTRQAIRGAGLIPHDVHSRVFDSPQAEQFVRAMEPALAALGIDPQNYLQRATPLQHVWRARRQALPQITVISTMLAPVGGVSEVRVVEPMKAIATDPTVTSILASDFEAHAMPEATPKVFIFHRPLLAGDKGLEPVRRLLALGYVVVCEFDDHPDYIPVLQGVADVQNFRAVHAVQTTTEPLAAVLRRENPEIEVFPNGVARLPDVVNFANSARLTLFFGGLNREHEWPPYLEALNNVAAMAGDRLHFQIVNDRGLFDGLRTPHKNFTPLCDYETYQRILSGCEVSFMPLMDSPFNRCKSDLKYLEASASRVVSLASPTVYGETIEDGRTGVIFRDPSELQQRLARMLADPDGARAIGDSARAYVQRHRMLAYQTARRIAWYRSLWARREELNRALLERVPELAIPAAGRRLTVMTAMPAAATDERFGGPAPF